MRGTEKRTVAALRALSVTERAGLVLESLRREEELDAFVVRALPEEQTDGFRALVALMCSTMLELGGAIRVLDSAVSTLELLAAFIQDFEEAACVVSEALEVLMLGVPAPVEADVVGEPPLPSWGAGTLTVADERDRRLFDHSRNVLRDRLRVLLGWTGKERTDRMRESARLQLADRKGELEVILPTVLELSRYFGGVEPLLEGDSVILHDLNARLERIEEIYGWSPAKAVAGTAERLVEALLAGSGLAPR